ncbi:MAG TPA: hypothetical protein VKX49_03340, partial [Bryobacteraceae bacterium]|nr:hypothetical protein [Bryobacteraceae bacterium]
TANLFSSQTQQFGATVTGNANTSVTWSLSPAAGTISSTGLYTAPASIAAQQTVTVTATSVADGSKSATATVTLNPPAPPAITQQPANASAMIGQTATFTVAATGAALSYQWQSMPSGAGSFGNISGATAASYTTPSLAQSDNNTQFRCVVTNAQGSVNTNAATLTVVSTTGTNFILSLTPGTLRNNFSGWVGMSVAVGSSPLSVTALGRFVASGNTGTHTLKIVDGNGNDISGASTQVNTAAFAAGGFAYGLLPSAIRLSANTTYYILSQETATGDRWYDNDTTAKPQPIGLILGPAYGNGSYNVVSNMGTHVYVPVDFQYSVTQ